MNRTALLSRNAKGPGEPRAGAQSRRRAFTLIEMMVVVVILAILASLIVPRLTTGESRVFDLAVDEVTDLLTMYAHRDSIGTRPVGLQFDPARRGLILMELNDDGDDGAAWDHDPYVTPVILPEVVDVDAILVFADGELVNIVDYPLTNAPGENRPSIELHLVSQSGEHRATLVLAPHGVFPRNLERVDAGVGRLPIDLDAAGMGREEW